MRHYFGHFYLVKVTILENKLTKLGPYWDTFVSDLGAGCRAVYVGELRLGPHLSPDGHLPLG